MTSAVFTSRGARAVPRILRCFAADPSLFLRALGWRLVLPALKIAVPIGTLADWMSARKTAPHPTAAAGINSVKRLLAQGGRLVVSGNCLERSLLLYRLLSQAGADVSLVMGVRRDAAAVAGHAWVELDGRPLADATTADYNVVRTWSTAAAAPVSR